MLFFRPPDADIARRALQARRLGVTTLCLDTRDDLTEARRLYARHGYREVAPFNDDKYAEHWFEKNLKA